MSAFPSSNPNPRDYHLDGINHGKLPSWEDESRASSALDPILLLTGTKQGANTPQRCQGLILPCSISASWECVPSPPKAGEIHEIMSHKTPQGGACSRSDPRWGHQRLDPPRPAQQADWDAETPGHFGSGRTPWAGSHQHRTHAASSQILEVVPGEILTLWMGHTIPGSAQSLLVLFQDPA